MEQIQYFWDCFFINMVHIHTFSKNEHLCGDIRISKLYAEGKAFIVYPIRVVYSLSKNNFDVPVKVLVSAPKKRFKHAVDRNKLKRLMREAYRLNKFAIVQLAADKNIKVQVAFNYVADKQFDFELINDKMQQALKKISTKLENYVSESD